MTESDPYNVLSQQISQLKQPLTNLIQNYNKLRDLNSDDSIQKLSKQLDNVNTKLDEVINNEKQS